MPATRHDCAALDARKAKLRHVLDDGPGIGREAVRGRFRYRDADGRLVTDEEIIARIAALAIPPAWEKVWICPKADGHIQATGVDARRRKQYRYHTQWRAVRDEAKYAGLRDFGRPCRGCAAGSRTTCDGRA